MIFIYANHADMDGHWWRFPEVGTDMDHFAAMTGIPFGGAPRGVPWTTLQVEQLPPRRADGEEALEGFARVVYLGRWSALAFWDRSVAKGPGAMCVVVVDAELPLHVIVTRAQAAWPRHFGRLDFNVVGFDEELEQKARASLATKR